MANKKIAIFGCGWSYDMIQTLMIGLTKYADEKHIDLLFYLNYASKGDDASNARGEYSVFQLPNLTEYDGIVLLGNTLFLSVHVPDFLAEIKKSKVPTISLELPTEDFPYIGTDNYAGMHGIVEHMIRDHGYKRFIYVSGPAYHQENVLRIKAYTDACTENGIEVSKEQFIESDWSEETAQKKVLDYLQLGNELPDAFICSNDYSAMGAISALKEMGYKIPQDVRVTGFDDLAVAAFHNPPIASVGRDSELIGYEGMRLLDLMIAGEEIAHETLIPAKVSKRCSCGCKSERDELVNYFEIDNSLYMNDLTFMSMDMYFRNLHNCLRDVNSMDELHTTLSGYFENKHTELHNLAIFLKPNLERNRNVHFIPELIYGRQGRRELSHVIVPMLSEIHEQLSSLQQNTSLVVVPLHSEGFILGYAVFSWNSELLNHNWLYIWTRQLNQAFEMVHHNIEIHTLNQKLAMLSRTDVLTNVYNRIGCEELGAKMLEDNTRDNLGSCVIMVDMDRMKHINDEYGHTAGDQALRTLTRIITESCPPEYIVSRFGGDEFVIVGTCETKEKMDGIVQAISYRVNEKNNLLNYPFSASFGGVWKAGGVQMSFEECISKADASMYEMKEINHKKMDADMNDNQ